VSPVHEGVAPVGVLSITLRLLGLVAMDVADDTAHVINVVVSIVRVVLPKDLDDLAARSVVLAPFTGCQKSP
jgi:hypothetical protein